MRSVHHGRNATMACPYLKETVMLFCDAYPIKKMLPLDRIATANPCLGEFHGCMLFGDAMARLGSAELAAGSACSVCMRAAAAAARKEGSS
ncbi:MAG: hypothetical protein JNM38_16420 [Acidobacteria bacterium]|jgi:hypothetical protein|nr:hypothetical protein [Acidobacteriota bacterium]